MKKNTNPFWKDKKILIKLGMLIGVVAYSFSFLSSCDEDPCPYEVHKLLDNSAITDLDGDGVADKFDMDMDGDTIWDWDDRDIDNDGIYNASDDDIDGDGIPNYEDYDADADNMDLHIDGECEWNKGKHKNESLGGIGRYWSDSAHSRFYIDGKSQADAEHDTLPYAPFNGTAVKIDEPTTLADSIREDVITSGLTVLSFTENVNFIKVRNDLKEKNCIIERTIIDQITVTNNAIDPNGISAAFLTANKDIDCVLRIYYQCHWAGDSLGDKYLALTTRTKEAAAATGQPIEKLGNFLTETISLQPDPEAGYRQGLYWNPPANKGFDLDFKTETVDSCKITFEFTLEQPLTTAGFLALDFNIGMSGKVPGIQ